MSGNVIGDVPGTDSLSGILILEDVIRACLKNHFCNLHAPICGIFCLHSVDVARYAALIQVKSTTNCNAHLAESIFQTRYSFIKRKEQLEMIGENIKTYRQKKGYTQEEVANRLHVTRQTISKWEKNYSIPDAEVLVKLADVLEVQTSQLLGVKVDSDVQTTEEKQNAYAEQLAHIAEQMAIRNRQRKRIWKTIGIAFAVIIVVCIVLIVMNIAFFSACPTTEDVQTYEETIMLEE